jgi:hypothetical protein
MQKAEISQTANIYSPFREQPALGDSLPTQIASAPLAADDGDWLPDHATYADFTVPKLAQETYSLYGSTSLGEAGDDVAAAACSA